MRAIQEQLPQPRHTEVQRVFVKSAPDVAWEVARHFDMATIPWVRLLFDIRLLPARLWGHQPAEADRRLGVDQVTESGKGLMVVHETPGKEVVVASVGQFWHVNLPFAKIEPADFKSFRTPGYAKLVPLPDDDERTLLGDELLPNAPYALTHHMNIEAPPEIVWSYLMQLGCDRAGWYSIDWLDHGGESRVDHLVPGWEKRSIGDRVAATPAQDGFFEVLAVEVNKLFALGGETERFGCPFKMRWAFVLEPIGADATHLISRAKAEPPPNWAEWLMGHMLYPPVHGFMSGAQLKHIRQMAERDAQMREMPVAAVADT